MENEKTEFMQWLFSQQDLPQMIAQSTAMHEDLRRMSAMGQEAIRAHREQMRAATAQMAAATLIAALTPTPGIIAGLGRQLKPFLDALAEDRRQRALVMSVFVRPKLHWKPHPAVRRLIDQLRREMRSQTQPQELDTIM